MLTIITNQPEDYLKFVVALKVARKHLEIKVKEKEKETWNKHCCGQVRGGDQG